MSRLIHRRQALVTIGAAGAALAAGCATDTPTSPSPTTPVTTGGTNTTCAVTPSETIGPYPSLTDFFRRDIREDRQGTQLTLTITVVNTNASCSPVSGVNVDIWQCDAAGGYSQYGSQGDATYLRGIQTTDAVGQVTFVTVFPGWYQGRATHIHVDITRNNSSLKVTQIAFPEATIAAVYATGVYASRGANPTSNASDNVFRDSLSSQLAAVSGDVASGLTATFQVGIAL